MPKKETFLNPIPRSCKACDTIFEISAKEQAFFTERNLVFPKLCPDCRQKKRRFARIDCIDCGQTFDLSELEGDFFERRGLSVPKRCPDCRGKRKVEREVAGK